MKKIFLIALVLALAGCVTSKKEDQSPTLATFDGTKITESQYLKKVQSLPKSVQALAAVKSKDFIEDMAAEHFLLKEALKQGLDKNQDVQDLMETARQKILIAKLVEKEVDGNIKITADEVEKYYELNKEDFMTPLSLRAAHILVKTEQEALAIKQALDQGADFEETARQKSTDATAIRGGDLGYFQKGQFVPEFDKEVFSMTKGEIRGPIKSAFGYHIIKLNDRVEPRQRELRAVHQTVEERLAKEKRSKLFKELVLRLKGNIKVDVNDEALKQVAR